MTKSYTITGNFQILKHLGHTKMGNPRYLVAIDGEVFKTLPNSGEVHGLRDLAGKTVTASYKSYRNDLAAFNFRAT
ncbi:hypothetical protein [Acidimangrovimonas pyrenivorans]|uniref:Uncharacterized protein n=1 Tax=Acidimangrovimonas pyrenivorans TaxID=2030798 RepID=A0ABV7AG39_9RHOB